jgi:predicted nucleic acid-binding protein
MSPDCFLDTNVLVYAAIGERSWPEQHARAREIIAENDFAVSGQVLQEFFVNVTRKSKLPMSTARAREWLDVLRERPCVPTDWGLVVRGAEVAERFRLSYWDGAVIAAAERSQTSILYTEDLNDGQLYGSVRAVNPFRPA